ncbi:hypothetical protein [Neorhizobium alkalisoli]|uniref:Uncharacterized protein n=1 Tax=Neorhizobium alkalisoli TaxID=528178 RepID=A0A561Q7V7_9HYPH|nr:hypothetical protein [Neorhizobium alkalisoli]TWF46420.1 hypothetical protein FHW37_115117 [Neorhizobium alkalisoli]
MLQEHLHHLPPLTSDDLAMLQEVFDQVCKMKSLEKMSQEAEDMAATILHYFQHGVQKPSQLLRLLV